ncbi:uncharacterized protein F5891DRAFT_985399 [Suillus fuscotomentosus]|uniref:Uncharacterized protein n=1 Tax=Suillus fuscotomentosus TaxID=1912939 RepID=A0AAD4DU77_9AGAM|nr:uncharacterized protein F5891DRAFT_985399 [Suillus fuscotomentosus]KAG1893941.1 hypothetical protein F5891DRAFT_985399 [Suillus fuscotomentosus]
MAANATVNATMISSSCALLPNITYSGQTKYKCLNGAGHLQFNFSGNPGVILMLSTLLNIEPSIQQEVAVPVTWEVHNTTNISVIDQYIVEVYFVQCSLLAVTTEAVFDMQTNSLLTPISVLQPSMQWKLCSGPSGHLMTGKQLDMLWDIQSVAGLNLSTEYSVYQYDGHPLSTFTFSPDMLEAAIVQDWSNTSYPTAHSPPMMHSK